VAAAGIALVGVGAGAAGVAVAAVAAGAGVAGVAVATGDTEGVTDGTVAGGGVAATVAVG